MQRFQLNSLLMFIWLTVGYAMIHVVAFLLCVNLWLVFYPPPSGTEYPTVTRDGEPLVSEFVPSEVEFQYRRLDGSVFEMTPGFRQQLPKSIRIPFGSSSSPIQWGDRICGLNDFQLPATYWYFVVPPSHAGTGYFTGYDERSRRQLGYIGRNGFSRELPTIEQSFPVEIYSTGYGGCQGSLAAPQLSSFTSRESVPWIEYRKLIQVNNVSLSTVFLLSNHTIYEINLASRTVKTLLADRPEIDYVTESSGWSEESGLFRLVTLSATGLTLIDPNTLGEKTLKIDFSVIPTHGGTRRLEYFPDQRMVIDDAWGPETDEFRDVRFWRLDAKGEVEWQAVVKLRSLRKSLADDFNIGLSIAAPAPVVSFGVILGGAFIRDPSRSSETFAERFASNLKCFVVLLLVSLVMGLVTGWAARRRERDVFGESSWFWPVLVGLCGWFGWVGYICLRPLPARLSKGRWMTSTPDPITSMGIEIFG